MESKRGVEAFVSRKRLRQATMYLTEEEVEAIMQGQIKGYLEALE
jgi:hypothetical protein